MDQKSKVCLQENSSARQLEVQHLLCTGEERSLEWGYLQQTLHSALAELAHTSKAKFMLHITDGYLLQIKMDTKQSMLAQYLQHM